MTNRPRERRNRAIPGFVTTLGGAVACVGTLFTWMTWSIALPVARGERLFGTSLVRGRIALAAGVILVVAGVAMSLWTRPTVAVPLGVVSAVAGIVAVYAVAVLATSHGTQVSEILHRHAAQLRSHPRFDARLPQILSRLGLQVSVSAVAWLSAAGAAIGLAGGVAAIGSRERPGTPAGSRPTVAAGAAVRSRRL